jgi:thymidylate synthase ThyX
MIKMEKRKINARIVADSINKNGERVTSYILTYPRSIHAELMTHRMFSRNAASSRAIPLKKMIQLVKDDPFIPIAWQKNHSGMQGTEYITNERTIEILEKTWCSGAEAAIATAQALDLCQVTKQNCNRLLEPYLWYTVLVTATEYDNFFELRCPDYRIDGVSDKRFYSKRDWVKAVLELGDVELTKMSDLDWLKKSKSGAEIHIQALAESMWDAKNKSIPNTLKEGEWHIPFGDQIDRVKLNVAIGNVPHDHLSQEEYRNNEINGRVKIAIARCARLSYMTFDGEIDYEKDIELHDRLLKSKHMSPFEHCTRAMTDYEHYAFRRGYLTNTDESIKETAGWCTNFKGFIPYRYLIENNLKLNEQVCH